MTHLRCFVVKLVIGGSSINHSSWTNTELSGKGESVGERHVNAFLSII